MGSYRNEGIFEVYRSGMHELQLIIGEIKRLAVIWGKRRVYDRVGNTFVAEARALTVAIKLV